MGPVGIPGVRELGEYEMVLHTQKLDAIQLTHHITLKTQKGYKLT